MLFKVSVEENNRTGVRTRSDEYEGFVKKYDEYCTGNGQNIGFSVAEALSFEGSGVASSHPAICSIKVGTEANSLSGLVF